MNFNNSTSRNFTLGIRNAGGGGGGGLSINANSSSGSAGGGLHHVIKYVYELPYLERKEICRIFDENNLWETLGGGLMGYSSSELSEFGRVFLRGSSPTDSLLTAWASQNHTILELFTLFGRLTHFRAMKVIARFVDPKYHVYIRDPEINATQELIQLDSPVSPGPVVGPGIGAPGGELKVQNNIGFHHRHPDSPKKMVDPAHQNEIPAEGVGVKAAASSSTFLESMGHLPQIPYPELLSATNNWDRRNILGKGGFGTVYKGLWKNTAVAIKRMEQRANHAYVESQMKQSLGELRCLNSCRHDNILPLYGFSLEGEHPCLVYQYMVNGSLEDKLLCRHKSAPLQWSVRYQAARGVACGIQFLHSIGPKPLIHGDIKSANILLDRNFEAKIGDFGLAREMPSSNESYVKVSRVHGTRPYLPDEYLRSKKLSTKVDTYSFGIMLFEIGTGQRAYEESRSKKFLRDFIEDAEGNYEPLRDQKGGGENPDIFWHFIKVGRSCTEKLAKNRPEMVQVLKAFNAFNMFLSQQSTQASSIRTGVVTGIPHLFDTNPNSRPASLLIPGGSSTNHRLSPEMRATSPYWMQAQSQAGYQTPPTISTNQSVHQHQQQSATASSNMKPTTYNQQQQQALHQGGTDMIRRSPLPSPSTSYPIPPMMNNGIGSGTPGMYQQPLNPFQQQQPQQYNPEPSPPPPVFNIVGGGAFSHIQNQALVLAAQAAAAVIPRTRNLSQQSGSGTPQVIPEAINENYEVLQGGGGALPPNNIPPLIDLPRYQATTQPAPTPTPPVAIVGQQQPLPIQSLHESEVEKLEEADYFPVFLMDKEEDKKEKGEGGGGEEASDSEDHYEWTTEQDGAATVIPLITELGIKDPQDS